MFAKRHFVVLKKLVLSQYKKISLKRNYWANAHQRDGKEKEEDRKESGKSKTAMRADKLSKILLII